MIWIILVVLVVVGFILYRGVRRVLMSVRAAKLKQKGVFGKREWNAIPFDEPSVPVRMVFNEVTTKSAYLANFKVMFTRFIDIALLADDKLNSGTVSVIARKLLSDISNGYSYDSWWSANYDLMKRESHMVQSAALFALMCTQDKGANIKRRLMEGKNSQAGNDMYLQQKTDREYFEFMNDLYPNFCQLVSILEPHKAVLIETVAGYLLTK
jgi:hypothetical protein